MAGLRSGLVSGLQSGLVSGLQVSAGYTLDTLSPADIVAITGQATPTWMARGGDASGALDLVGSDDLTDIGSPTKEVADAVLGGTATGFTHGTGQSMDGPNGSFGDVGAETITGFVVVNLTTASTASKQIFGNRTNAAGNNGWILKGKSGGGFDFTVDTPSENNVVGVNIDHGTGRAEVVLFTRSIGGAIHGIWTQEGSDTNGVGLGETMTNADPASVGAGPLRTCQGHNFGVGALWIGTDGDFGNAASFAAARLAIAQALGYE